MRPFTITSTVSATSIATPRFCSISSTEISPSAARRFSMSATWRTMTGASPSVGSSITSRVGLKSSARAMASICCSPPESSAPPLPFRSASRGNVWYTRATVHAPECPPAARRRCSSTVSDGHTRRPCGTYPTPRLVMAWGGSPRISSPASRTLPDAGTRPVIALQSVVLPMPFLPTTAVTPRSRLRETSCSACARP